MKRFSLFLAIIFASLSSSWAQTITVGANPTNLSCGGGNVDLTALGTSTTPVFGDDFNNGQVAPGWAASAAAQFDNPCGAPVDGTTYLWMGPGTAAPREMTTASVDVSCGGTVCFDFKFVCESCGDSSPCEGADTYAEGVSLQFSTNGGATWTDFAYFAPNGDLLTAYPGNVYSPYASGNTPFTTWNNYCFTIPAGAETAGTMFQLHQWGSSGTAYDHWGIDNFYVYANPCAPYYYDWDHIPGAPDAPDVTTNITQTTTFTCCYTNGTNSVCESVTVTVESIDITNLTIGTEPCLGDNAGTVSVSVTGGAAPYTYTLAGPTPGTNGTGNFSNLAPGNYTITINDGGSCVVDSSFTIDPGPACCTVTATATDALCNAQSSGTATANPANGVAPYSYQWDAGTGNQTTQTANNLPAGNYSVTITDFNGCQSTTNVVVGEPTALNSNATPTDVSCNGVCDGQIAISAPTGGTAPYQYNLNGGVFGGSETFTGLCAGTYNLITEDANGCQVLMSNIAVTEPTDVTLVEQSTTPATCGAANGDLTVLAGGGTPGYQYDIGGAQQGSPTFTGLTAGSYTVTVTDANGCTETVNVTVASSAGPAPFVDTQSPVTCAGGLNGSVTIAVGGGTAPFQFSLDAGPNQGSNTFPVSAGNHTVTVTDANGCVGDVNFTINEPTPLTYSTVITDATCNGVCDGEIEITAQDATPPYQYSDDNGLTFQASNILTGLCAGNVNVVVQDANGCIATQQVVLTHPAVLAYNAVATDLLCNNDFTGELALTANGGTAPYQYSIDAGVNTQGGGTFSFIAAATYNVQITDANGCIVTGNEDVNEPTQVAWDPAFAVTDPVCFNACDGTVNAPGTGGTQLGAAPFYTYNWSGNISTSTSSAAANVCAGNYNVSITDANGCSIDTNITLIDPPALVIPGLTVVDLACYEGYQDLSNPVQNFDGDITITTPTTGTAPYNYSIDDGANFQAGNQFSGLPAGNYDIVVTDANGCEAISNTTIYQPDSLYSIAPSDWPACFGETVTVQAFTNGGSVPYTTFEWTNNLNATVETNAIFDIVVTEDITYTYQVTDANGCMTAPVSYSINPTPELMLTPGPDEMICVGEDVDISVTATGGELIDFGTYQGYSYSWDTGVAGDTVEVINVGPVVETVYTVTVTDQCGAVKDTFVTVGIHPDPITDVLGGGNGCAPDTMSFENPSYVTGTTVLWDFGNGVTSTDPNPTNVLFANPGCFDVTLTAVSDQGCTTTSTYPDLVCIYEDPIPGFYTDPNSPSILDPTTTVISTAQDAVSWYYTFDGFGTSSVENPTITFPVDEETTVNICQTVTSAEGCTATICSPLDIHEEILFYVPNIFTPDGDLYNETFHPVITSGIDMFDYHLTIFNRWGEIIFESYNYDYGWNGHYGNGGLVEDGVYIWQIEFGEKLSDKKQTHRGHVTVLK